VSAHPYKQYMKVTIPRWKAENPGKSHKEAFAACAEQWKSAPENPKNGGLFGLAAADSEDSDDSDVESTWSVAVPEKGGANKRAASAQQATSKRRKTDTGFFQAGATISCPECSQKIRAPVAAKALRCGNCRHVVQ
jgi:hypothetical protein